MTRESNTVLKMASSFTHALVRQLDRVSAQLGRTANAESPEHLRVGKRGEEEAFFYLQRAGYTVIARNWRSHRLRGDLDLIGWQDGFLCFVEVKTRMKRDTIAAEFAVNEEKRKMLRRMARAYLRRYKNSDRIAVRFDVVSVYLTGGKPEFDLFQGVFSWH